MLTNDEYIEMRRLFLDDLRHMGTLIITHNKPVEEASIRSASVILRRWLIEDKLAILAKTVQAEATFPCVDTSPVFEEIPRQPSTEYFLTGGVRFDQGKLCLGVSSFSSPPPESGSLLPIDRLEQKMLTLHQFKSQPRMYFLGTNFSCEEIIKYTANKLGGVHIDFSRQGNEKYAQLNEKYAKLDEAAAYMKFGGPLPQGQLHPSKLYIPLERTGSEILSGAHIEIIAAAASLIQVHFDGKPVMQISVKKSWWSRVRPLFGPARVTNIFEDGKQLQQKRHHD
ncbi:hypothetical protein [Bradyrhizobium sp.]|jgi:hypothetical protein|uniref:hypothetical protein n=1 Tax=Bradyrhizobium sp. TaxID=376 RepID=UPI002E04AFF7|nr:hypothetical protein [Bradyrhizobium sp.]